MNFNAFLTSGDPSDGISVGGNCTHVWKGQSPSFVENIINGKPIQNPQSDSNQPETKVWRKVRGKICTVLTPKSGYVRFKLDRKDLEAHFSFKDYVTKEIKSVLSEEVHLGRAVVIDVERQMLYRGACYRALSVRDDHSSRSGHQKKSAFHTLKIFFFGFERLNSDRNFQANLGLTQLIFSRNLICLCQK